MNLVEVLGGIAVLLAIVVAVLIARADVGATPTDCRRACEPACMVEWIDASDEQSMVCRCGACP